MTKQNSAAAKQRRENVEVTRTGTFTMDIVHAILSCCTVEEAKAAALKWIEDHVDGVRPENIQKAKKLIKDSTTVKNLSIGMSNFILAFQGFAVVK